MAIPDTNPCPWGVTWDDVAATCTAASGLTEDQQAAAVLAAEGVVWTATGERFGVCSYSAAPTRTRSCSWPHRCVCRGGTHVDLDPLRRAPVVEVTSVVVAGAEVDPEDYLVADDRWLVRTGGPWWPACWTPGDPDAFRVEWSAGVPPPRDLLVSAVVPLACELAKKLAGLPCSVPDEVVSVSREGAQFVMRDLTRLVLAGLVGPPSVLAAIVRTHPAGATVGQPAGAVSPEDVLATPPIVRPPE